MRAGDLLAKGSGGELDMDATPGAGHFQEWSGGLMDGWILGWVAPLPEEGGATA